MHDQSPTFFSPSLSLSLCVSVSLFISIAFRNEPTQRFISKVWHSFEIIQLTVKGLSTCRLSSILPCSAFNWTCIHHRTLISLDALSSFGRVLRKAVALLLLLLLHGYARWMLRLFYYDSKLKFPCKHVIDALYALSTFYKYHPMPSEVDAVVVVALHTAFTVTEFKLDSCQFIEINGTDSFSGPPPTARRSLARHPSIFSHKPLHLLA